MIEAKQDNPLIVTVYGDTDSVVDSKIHCMSGEKMLSDIFNESKNQYKTPFITSHGAELYPCDEKILNYDDTGLHYTKIKYISRHKVNKPMWRLRTKSGKEILCTEDHSLIIYRDGEKISIKPDKILPTDKIVTIK